ncbi:CDP-alcohol phosphatidyltransferase family protein [Alteromonas macleodii]|uniref:CDP-alcohol phosphatidyltransferase n=1 Tax=Alteromonas macleodii (strain English Channel 673) TaxID=1004788 RepID=A0AB32ZY15_ALTME|nr:CDP-alcohol phosphatidyltransferase family protein [Alteromonas macleodii]AFT74369.1 putative CDP-alcohol phosphatidyltransferase [Alteromonas macleodii str. 'English Channel 673']MBL3812301.1 CDP-alcohol phosphatidyltransferase family protein [Alteromonas macleodii]MBL3885817.1 CDP-alcohol phosphatidyltransferase family protein [Alteromonas macleodii]
MLDAKVTPFIKPLLKPLIKALDSKGVTPNQVTLAGFVIGVLALPFIIFNWWNMALACIILNRVFDGIDGELARYQQSSSSAGGFLDICLDFLFYASIPLAFGIANPQEWGIPAMVLLATFIGTGSSFLAFAIAAEKFQIDRPQFANKSFYYMQGLTEGTETILVFLAFCIWPQYFAMLAYVFAAACAVTVITRIVGGFSTLHRVERDAAKSERTVPSSGYE